MPNCQFTTTESDGTFTHTCSVCGTVRVTDKPRHVRECRKAPPNLAVQAFSLASWGTSWLARGARKSSDVQYNQRLEICRSCPLFKAAEQRCTSCGCYIPWKAAGISAKGKSDCPEGKWPIIG